MTILLFVLLVIGDLIAFVLGSALKTLTEINRRLKSTTDRLDELSSELGPLFKGGQELIDDILSSKLKETNKTGGHHKRWPAYNRIRRRTRKSKQAHLISRMVKGCNIRPHHWIFLIDQQLQSSQIALDSF
jgi:hypothetical protein|tara:strand:+ start:839 stop:1231 length:393 start_codon:yes stop_codon:yes gene_type:complete